MTDASHTSAPPKRHVMLVGFMGSGKSTVGRLLAEAVSLPFVDLDELIERREGRSVPGIFAKEGEAGFREAEHEALASLRGAECSVVACGGGVVLLAENRSLLKSLGCVVYLEVSAGEALARIGDVADRPLLSSGGAKAAAALLLAREHLYRAIADVVIDTGGKPADQVALEASKALRAAGCVA